MGLFTLTKAWAWSLLLRHGLGFRRLDMSFATVNMTCALSR